MIRHTAFAIALAAALITTAAHAQEREDIQAPRGQEIQAPRGQEVQAPRGDEIQAPRWDDGHEFPTLRR